MMLRLLPIALIIFLASVCSAAMQPLLMKQRVGTPPHLVLKSILSTNSSSQPTAKGTNNQAPYITWLADSDSRLEPSSILPTKAGHIYTVRNLANQLTTSMGSVDYGIHFLHTPVLLITGNSDNEAIALLLNNPGKLPSGIRAELDHLLRPAAMAAAQQTAEEKSAAEKQLTLVEANVDFQVQLAMERYSNRLNKDRLVIIGAVYDLSNQYGHGPGRLQIININGVTAKKKMLRMRLLKPIPPTLLTTLGRERSN